jgi:hypothetical protein
MSRPRMRFVPVKTAERHRRRRCRSACATGWSASALG